MTSNKCIVRVRHSKGTTRIELVNKLSTTITQLKQLIYEQLSDKPLITTQQLTVNGKSNDIPFENNVTLSSLNITHGHMFYLKIITSNDSNTNNNNKKENNENATGRKRKLNEMNSFLENTTLPPKKRARTNNNYKNKSNNNSVITEKKVNEINNKSSNEKKPFQTYNFIANVKQYEIECKKLGLFEDKIPSLQRNQCWLYVNNPFPKYTKSKHCGKWMIYASKNKLFYTNLNRHALIDWKCNYCNFGNNPSHIVCGNINCLKDKNESDENTIDCHMMSLLDMQWLRVIKYTLNGKLGNISAKVSTSLDGYGGNGVIIIYTYDWNDKKDVLNVAKNITKWLNIKKGFSYKTDESTLNGQYCTNSKEAVSKYKYQPKNPNILIETRKQK